MSDRKKTGIVMNAMIESATIRLDRGSFLSCWLTLNYGGTVQGFGGHVLGAAPDAAAGEHSRQPNLAAEWLVQCLLVGGVQSFDELAGKAVRVHKTDEWGDILGIGHVVKDHWFYPQDSFDRLARDRQASIDLAVRAAK